MTVVGCGDIASAWAVVIFAVVAAVSSVVVGETNKSNADKEKGLLYCLQ